MKQKYSMTRRHRKPLAFLLLCFAFSAAIETNAQTKGDLESTDQIIKSLHSSPDVYRSVNSSDKALIEAALGSPEFAERLAAHSGTVYVMMHGLEFENVQGITAAGHPVVLLDKAGISAQNPGMFFILQDIQRTSEAAYINMVMHDKSAGTPEKLIEADMLMARNSGQWVKQTMATKNNR